ncbi:plastocyanin/azurin family copper-binding protein [Geminocystis sp. GBBB08]|uniref:plastocyanin/azurin family copper-binding protein n=1 Tax=Geminocystis sp. GBBB08 TaxID=2604140 RepID=UPI0027E2A607|nr:plastocyanin/azurin family copper-binding protein [Geminocystis sp. GBBB08]MBL1209978.1 biphenyl 2,3-dioxygenase [Geminocystis sp. GBBB08]
MKLKNLFIILLICVISFNFPLKVEANIDFETVNISLGNTQGELKFIPNQFDFKAGQKYKLILDNPSPEKHYFTAKDFADASWTQKVQAGKVEIKGAIHELELKPEGNAEWVFIPEKQGIYQLYCSIKGHKEAGMTGKITIN